MLDQREFTPVAEGLIAGTAAEPELDRLELPPMRHGHVPAPGVLPALHLRGRRGAAAPASRNAVDLDDPVLPAEVAAVRRRARRRLRALRRRLRRAARRGARRGAADRGRPGPAAHRDADGADADPGARRRGHDHLRVPAGRGRRGGGPVTEDVAVVGVGIHPFGRHEGVTGLQMAAIAARRALADAGVGWEEVDFAAGGSDAGGNADTSVASLGLTGLPFINVKNGCATGGSALTTAHAMLVSGAGGDRPRRRLRQAPAGRVQPAARGLGHRLVVRRDRPDAHHAVLRDEDPALHGASTASPRRRWPRSPSKAFANGSRNPNAWRRKPLSEDEVLASKMVNHPLDPVHVLLARRGRGRAGPGARARACGSSPARRSTCARSPSARGASAPSRSSARRSRSSRRRPPTAEAAAAAFEQAGIGPGRRRRRAGAGHRVGRRGHAPGRDRAVRARRAGAR